MGGKARNAGLGKGVEAYEAHIGPPVNERQLADDALVPLGDTDLQMRLALRLLEVAQLAVLGCRCPVLLIRGWGEGVSVH